MHRSDSTSGLRRRSVDRDKYVKYYGLGQHIWTLNTDQFVGFNKSVTPHLHRNHLD